jgi:hypothetical protein
MLYAQTRADGTRLAHSSAVRAQFGRQLTNLLASGSSDLGFVSAVQNCCLQLSSTNSLLLNAQSDTPSLPAFPVSPDVIGESALRCSLSCDCYSSAEFVWMSEVLCLRRSLSYTTAIRVLEEGLLSAGVFFDAYSRAPAPEAAGGSKHSRGRSSTSSATGAPLVLFRCADATPAEIASAWSNLGRLYEKIRDGEVDGCCDCCALLLLLLCVFLQPVLYPAVLLLYQCFLMLHVFMCVVCYHDVCRCCKRLWSRMQRFRKLVPP